MKSLAGGSTSPARVLTAEVVAPMVLAPLGAAIRLRRVIEDPDADLLYFGAWGCACTSHRILGIVNSLTPVGLSCQSWTMRMRASA